MPRSAHARQFRFLAAAVLGAALVGACGQAGQDRRGPRDRVPAAAITGPAVACIPLKAFSETRVRNGRTIDFMNIGGKGWRNVLPQDCPTLAAERAIAYETSLSQLCSSDTFKVLETFGPSPRGTVTCGLGEFTPIQLR